MQANVEDYKPDSSFGICGSRVLLVLPAATELLCLSSDWDRSQKRTPRRQIEREPFPVRMIWIRGNKAYGLENKLRRSRNRICSESHKLLRPAREHACMLNDNMPNSEDAGQSILQIVKDSVLFARKLRQLNCGLETDGDLYGVLWVNAYISEFRRFQRQFLAGGRYPLGLIELAKNLELQDWQDSLRAEIQAALGAEGENIAYDIMPLLNTFIKNYSECIRLRRCQGGILKYTIIVGNFFPPEGDRLLPWIWIRAAIALTKRVREMAIQCLFPRGLFRGRTRSPGGTEVGEKKQYQLLHPMAGIVHRCGRPAIPSAVGTILYIRLYTPMVCTHWQLQYPEDKIEELRKEGNMVTYHHCIQPYDNQPVRRPGSSIAFQIKTTSCMQSAQPRALALEPVLQWIGFASGGTLCSASASGPLGSSLDPPLIRVLGIEWEDY
ncbi:hypothetical protein GGX14DRAFT_594508 [Mycena pura]|uniref:Uncharacterized protein n=1 Tax=Mycena pura TaxID=153505 RepID=A0AAD6XZR4_9AGAR|nr:hypothetical protein GGX14DRAFT_594508 [Mycena pura]